MTDNTTPKLLTEAEWLDILAGIHHGTDELMAELRERGLIAEDPVDPLLIEARAFLVGHWAATGKLAERVLAGDYDSSFDAALALAAIKRGIEIGKAERPQLTLDDLRAEVIEAFPDEHMMELSDFYAPKAREDRQVAEAFVERLHAALSKGEK